MGAFLDKPKTEKQCETGGGLGLRYGISSMQGWRIEMEDAHCAKIGLPCGLDEWSFFAVFDGHAGPKVSAISADNLLETIIHGIQHQFLNKKPRDYIDNYNAPYCRLKMTRGWADQDFVRNLDQMREIDETTTDDEMTNDVITTTTTTSTTDPFQNSRKGGSSPSSVTNATTTDTETETTTSIIQFSKPIASSELEKVKKAIHDGFLQLDAYMRAALGDDRSGSTAVCAMISPEYFFFANCGDSRAVLSRGGEAFFSTEDHKPINPGERERIQNAGGSVMIQRVNGSLAVSRALGDFEYKQVEGKTPGEQLVSPEPEVTIETRQPKYDEFLVLACDGIFDVMSNEELCDFIRYQLRIHNDLEYICSSVIDTCLHKGSRDNMSIVLVVLPGAPTVTKEAIEEDEQINRQIREEVEEMMKEDPGVSLTGVLNQLLYSEFKNLPPGGGIDSKRKIIEEVINRIRPE